MKLNYPEEHAACCNFVASNTSSAGKYIPLADCVMRSGDAFVDVCQVTEIVSLLNGKCSVSLNGIKEVVLGKGGMLLLPVSSSYSVTALEDCRFIIFRMNHSIELCGSFTLEQLKAEKSKHEVGLQSTQMLKMNDIVWDYTTTVARYLDDGLRCSKFAEMKVAELMYLLRAYYTKAELVAFFHPILNNDMDFARIIMENWSKVRNKAELAAVVNLSPSRFGVKFKEVFGMSPYQWLISRRSERMYYKLVHSRDSFKQISEELSFGSVQHFNDFCKKQFGRTPGQIRNSRATDIIPGKIAG